MTGLYGNFRNPDSQRISDQQVTLASPFHPAEPTIGSLCGFTRLEHTQSKTGIERKVAR
jgi:hypothetical protein